MSPLAGTVYDLLRQRASQSEPRVTYAALAEQLRDAAAEFVHVTHRSRELYAALNEVGQECRRLGLPPLPALVVRADTGRPGEAYYQGACTGIVYRGEQVAAWRDDLEAVKRATYPARKASAGPK
jgi:hypothetical protein